LLLSRKEKANTVIKLANEGKTTREIAKVVHNSLQDIDKIIHKITGDDESPAEKEKTEERKQKWLKSLSHYVRAFGMFRDNKSLVDAAIEIDQEANIILNYYGDYLRLESMDGLISIYRDLKDDSPVFFHYIEE
jgi:hypothetical protein